MRPYRFLKHLKILGVTLDKLGKAYTEWVDDSSSEKITSLYPFRNHEKALQGIYATSFRELRAVTLRNWKGPVKTNGRREFLCNQNVV